MVISLDWHLSELVLYCSKNIKMSNLANQQVSDAQEMSYSETSPLTLTEQNSGQSSFRSDSHNKISVFVFVLVILFSLSSWIAVNGMWVEVPVFVEVLPEKWNLPSYLVIIIQIANISPLLYVISKVTSPQRVEPWPVIYVLFVVGAISCILSSEFWDYVSVVGDKQHSVALFVLTGFLAVVDCTSSVVYLPYMAQFRTKYMTAFYIGEGLSGFLPGIIGLLQYVGSESDCTNQTVIINHTEEGISHQLEVENDSLQFSVSTFFMILFAMICISGIAFVILHHLPRCRKEHLQSHEFGAEVSANDEDNTDTGRILDDAVTESNGGGKTQNVYVSNLVGSRADNTEHHRLSHLQYIFVLAVMAWVATIQNGMIPSIQSYSCLPYGSLAYTLTVRLSALANPLFCFLAFFLSTSSLRIISLLTLVSTVLAGYQLALATLSPEPPLKGQSSGTVLVVSF